MNYLLKLGGVSLDRSKIRRKAKVRPSINGILGIISFSTRIPVKRYITIEEMSSSVIIWPYIGLCIGVIAAIIFYILTYVLNLPSYLTAALIYCFIIWFTGFNHIDGLLDMGDGLMAHGTPEKRLEIMRDSMVGTGAIATFFIVAILTILSLASIPVNYMIPSIILMELSSKVSMLTTMVFGRLDSKGIAVDMTKGIDYKVLLFTIIIALIISYFLLQEAGLFVIMAATICGLYLSNLADKSFNCVTGDIMGASNEIGRLIALLFIIINLNIIV
ncbi:MAG: adenosylcobinamide-GDP ribazoletransferase [Methanosphaera stadtmanae]|nr:adenosylcobinamide-GDP ribazoletransferase [Methanosphaera stadtmanae]